MTSHGIDQVSCFSRPDVHGLVGIPADDTQLTNVLLLYQGRCYRCKLENLLAYMMLMCYQVIVRWLLNTPREPLSLFPIVVRDYLAARFAPICPHVSGCASRSNCRAHLPHVRVPGLVVRGEYDTIVPERWAEEAARLLPQGQLVVIARAAHDVNYDAPVELTRVVRAFMSGELS
jgi:pimeloyl-ACP methyl ester carboxylesterase